MRKVIPDSNMALCIDGRLSQPPEEVLVSSAFAQELHEQLWLSEEMSWVDMAHVISLIEADVIENNVGADLLSALRKLQDNSTEFQPDPMCGDLFTNREVWLEQHTSAVGWLCAGRARREGTTVAFHLTLKKLLLTLADEVSELTRVMLAQAAHHKTSIMPDYTYMQAGQPTSFGHYLLSFVSMFTRDLARINALYDRVNCSPAGCGGINGSTLQIDRDKLATLLGFAKPVMHTRDAMWQTDISIEVISTLTAIIITLDRFSEDLLYFVTKEFNYIELQDAYSRASKIMPQKKNPYGLAYIRALANKVIGIQTMVVATQRTPTGQIDNRLFVYGEIPNALNMCIDGICLLTKILEGLQFNTPRALNRVKESFAMATELAELISTENNLDYRAAHKVIGKIVRKYSQSKKYLSELTELELNEIANEVIGRSLSCPKHILEALNSPELAIENKSGLGGASQARVNEMIEHNKGEVSHYQNWITNERAKVKHAESSLLKHTENVINQAQ